MTKRLSVGVLLFTIAVFAFAVTVNAERAAPREWVDKSDPYRGLPLFFRASAGTTWVQVNSTGGCDPALVSAGGDIHDNTDHTASQVFCFEGPDSLWPAGPSGVRFEDWTHFARNLPPYPQPSRWHVNTRFGDGSTGVFNAWCGCDSVGTNPACVDVAFWVNQEGYGAEWEETMVLDASLYGAQSGGTLTFSVRYDVECVYDYLFLEYFNPSTSTWDQMSDSLDVSQAQAGTAAVFNGVSGNPDTSDLCDNGQGGLLDGNYFDDSTKNPFGPGLYHGNAVWYHNVQFPIPSGIDFQFRFRGSTDPGWGDYDGRGDTDGVAQVDNIIVAFANGDSLVENFEFGDFDHVRVGGVNGTPTAGLWSFGTGGNSYDGWHLEFDPRYKNKGNTCTFSNDWMWAAKPATTAIPSAESGFEFFLASPTIPCDGWTGGTCIWSQYQCMPDERDDFTNTLMRYYDASVGAWAPWDDFDGFVMFAGCEFWNVTAPNASEDLTPFLGTNVDSLQMGWLVLDQSHPGEFSWGKHGAVQYMIDNVVFGSFDGSGTIYTARGIDIFADTFSRADPSHTPFLQNAEQGQWPGRPFAQADSLQVQITDNDGMNTVTGSALADLYWRADSGPGTAFETWQTKSMHFSEQLPTRPDGEGTYRIIIGNDLGGNEDYTPGGDGLIWTKGQTVEYYIKVRDDLGVFSTWPSAASDPTDPGYFEFSVLPFNINTNGGVATQTDPSGRPVDPANPNAHYILLVDDYTRNALDFEASVATGSYDPTGGAGFGNFDQAVVDQPEDMVERALAILYGGDEDNPRWDKYDVQGAGSSVQCEPRGSSNVGAGLGAYMTDDSTIPYYDALIWLQGTFDGYSYADTTRLELANFIFYGGKFYNSGDQVAFHLGSAGNNADSTIGFMADYLGMAFTAAADEVTQERKLNITGVPGRSLSGVTLGLYGECPFRRTFDKVYLSTPGGTPPISTPDSVAVYTSGGAADNNRLAMVKCVQNNGLGGVAVSDCFGLEVLLSDASRACLLGRVITLDFGLTVNNAYACIDNGVDAPVVSAGRFGFELASARPNPFTEATSIQFSVPTTTHVSIEVFNILGQKVRTLVDENLEADSYVRNWDGRADDGRTVSSGIYFYRMVAGDFSATKKAVLLK